MDASLPVDGTNGATSAGAGSAGGIRPNGSAPPLAVPPGHIGPVTLPGSGRLIWWTGRVAIGLRHEPEPRCEPVSQSAWWVQDLMLGRGRSPLHS